MTIIGIAAEYNPFHKGHEYHIRRAKELCGGDAAAVCVMSGNFVQRGEAAAYEKHVRAKAAVECGADLVLELPVPYALSSAERFASASAAILDSLGCVDAMAFGSESGDAALLDETAELLLTGAADAEIKGKLAEGMSYAAAVQRAAESISGKALPLLRERNDILAVEYIKALKRLGSDIRPLPIKRSGAFPAASELRKAEDMTPALPLKAAEIFRAEPRSDMRLLESAVLARLRSMTAEELAELPDAEDGMGDRIAKAARSATGLDSLYAAAAAKRYPQARIRRAVMCAFIGIKAGENTKRPPYARVLAMNGRGRQVLKSADESFAVITKPSSGKAYPLMLTEARATDLYVLSLPEDRRFGGQEWTTSPYVSSP
ncbi:MAG: nucleotidyltransferase family protein [Oscillospiraceae bacterium]|nr:nucleotidyltransferase family protein [Oscillospiraceae bacterium]